MGDAGGASARPDSPWLAVRPTDAPYPNTMTAPMQPFVRDTEAVQVSAEQARRGIPPATGVHVAVEVTEAQEASMATLAEAGRAFDRLAGEPDLFPQADPLAKRAG